MKKRTEGEIDRLLLLEENMTPDEMSEYLHDRFLKDQDFFEKLLNEQQEKINRNREKPEIIPILKEVKKFYESLILDGYVKKDFTLFNIDKLKSWKYAQAEAEYFSLLKELDATQDKEYKEVFKKANRAYVINYEILIDQYLVEIVQKLSNHKKLGKSDVLTELKNYNDGKHAVLFRYLIPQVRNSIQHRDFIIDPKQPKITFYDQKKQPLSFTLDEYEDVFCETFFLMLSFEIQKFDMVKDFLDIILESTKIVSEFLKKNDLKLLPSGEQGLSVLDLAVLIKTKEFSANTCA